ncbi:MAG: N-acyl homoserine lactonase family protein [Pyramidobacter sp.]|nr:N-acyl homoserine lactonase family protein [Pyramidobacter sp.]
MGFQIDLLTDVFPGKSSAGALGLSTCAMIRGGQKSILFDTAAHGVIKIIERRWKELNIDPEKVEMVFLSHMHYDHLNNLACYPNAEVVIGRREWEYATQTKDEWTPLESVQYLKNNRKIRFVEDNEEIIPGIRAIWTPGHTPGHMSMTIETEEGLCVLAGDAVKNRSELEMEYSDQYVDKDASASSIRRIKSMAYKVLPGHDGYLYVKDGKVIPERELYLDILLPKCCTGGAGAEDGVYHLSVK